MSIGRLLSWTWYGVLDLMLCCAKFAVYGALIIVIAPLLFVLAAQLYGWSQGGNWHPVPVTEFLQILGVETHSRSAFCSRCPRHSRFSSLPSPCSFSKDCSAGSKLTTAKGFTACAKGTW